MINRKSENDKLIDDLQESLAKKMDDYEEEMEKKLNEVQTEPAEEEEQEKLFDVLDPNEVKVTFTVLFSHPSKLKLQQLRTNISANINVKFFYCLL